MKIISTPSILNGGIHRCAIARKYDCIHNTINKYIKEHELVKPVSYRITFLN